MVQSTVQEAVTGYGHQLYATAFTEVGTPRLLPGCGGWVIEREIRGSSARDAMGCYPIFVCQDWSRLNADLNQLGRDLVSLTVVTDPLADISEAALCEAFPHLMVRYKNHLLVRLGSSPETFVHPHHMRNAAKALRTVRVKQGAPSAELLTTWITLYGNLIARHNISGLTAFSAASFAVQFQVPGLVVQWAEAEGEIVGMVLWYLHGRHAYYHLGAYSAAGYELKCSYALFLTAIESFASSGIQILCLGAGAGLVSSGVDGLTRFKQGWSNATKSVHLCGRVFDLERYQEICRVRNVFTEDYFPAYRRGELP